MTTSPGDTLAAAQPEQLAPTAHDADDLAGDRRRVVGDAGDLGASRAAGGRDARAVAPGRSRRAEDHVAVVDVRRAGSRPDRWRSASCRRARWPRPRPRSPPSSPRTAATSSSRCGLTQSEMSTTTPSGSRPERSRKPASGRSVPSRSNAAGEPRPTFQPSAASPAATAPLAQGQHRAGPALDPSDSCRLLDLVVRVGRARRRWSAPGPAGRRRARPAASSSARSVT